MPFLWQQGSGLQSEAAVGPGKRIWLGSVLDFEVKTGSSGKARTPHVWGGNNSCSSGTLMNNERRERESEVGISWDLLVRFKHDAFNNLN